MGLYSKWGYKYLTLVFWAIIAVCIIYTWWLIPLSEWVITPVINGISRVNPLITGVITHLLSGMSHQVLININHINHFPSTKFVGDFSPIEAQQGTA